jgi:hypothetical protein
MRLRRSARFLWRARRNVPTRQKPCAGMSRGAATVCSPGREPWGNVAGMSQAPEGRQKPCPRAVSVAPSGLSRSRRGVSQGLRPGLQTAAPSGAGKRARFSSEPSVHDDVPGPCQDRRADPAFPGTIASLTGTTRRRCRRLSPQAPIVIQYEGQQPADWRQFVAVLCFLESYSQFVLRGQTIWWYFVERTGGPWRTPTFLLALASCLAMLRAVAFFGCGRSLWLGRPSTGYWLLRIIALSLMEMTARVGVEAVVGHLSHPWTFDWFGVPIELAGALGVATEGVRCPGTLTLGRLVPLMAVLCPPG